MRMEPCGVRSISTTLNPPGLRLLISLNPYQLQKPLVLRLDICLQDFWGPVLLLLHQPHLPRVPPPLHTAATPAQPPATPAASEMQPPATAPANQQPESAFCPRRSPRLNSEPGRVCTIKGLPGNPFPQSEKSATMAGTYPFTVPYNQCLGARTDRLSFSSLYLEERMDGANT